VTREQLVAECADVQIAEDRTDGVVTRVWCILQHRDFGTITTSGPTEEAALQEAGTLVRRRHQRRADQHAAERRASGEAPVTAPDCYDHADEDAA
jgi:hypothetical protein